MRKGNNWLLKKIAPAIILKVVLCTLTVFITRANREPLFKEAIIKNKQFIFPYRLNILEKKY